MDVLHSDRQVDQSAIRVSHGLTILSLTTAFVLDSWHLVALVAVVNLLGAAVPRLSLFRQVYLRLLKPAGVVKPDVMPDHPEPHRFAQALGGTCVAISAGLLVSGYAVIGWIFSWLVIGLAAFNILFGFCAGCFTYYQMNRLGVAGFEHRPLRRG